MIRLVILRLLESYFRHRFLYLLPIPIMIAAGAYYFISADRLYVTGGVLYVQNDSYLGSLSAVRDTPFSYLTTAQRASNEIRDLMYTDAFVRSIISETSLEEKMSQGASSVKETLDDTRKAIWAQPIGENEVAINTAHVDPNLSYELSLSAINRFIQWKINLDRVQSGTAEEFFGELTEEYRLEVEQARDELRAYLEAHPEPVRGTRSELERLEVDRLTSLLTLAGTRYARALEQDESARLATSQAEADVRQTYFLVDAPSVQLEPQTSRRQLAMNAAIFVAAGLILTLLGIVAGALTDHSFRFPIDVQNGLGLPALATVTDMTPKYRFWQIRAKRNAEAATKEREELRRQLTEGVPLTIPEYKSWQIRKKSEAKIAAKVRDELVRQNPELATITAGEQDEHDLALAEAGIDQEVVIESPEEIIVEADVEVDDEAGERVSVKVGDEPAVEANAYPAAATVDQLALDTTKQNGSEGSATATATNEPVKKTTDEKQRNGHKQSRQKHRQE